MSCCHIDLPQPGCDGAFTVDASRITFGRGCLAEAGERARGLGMTRVALVTDARVRRLAVFETLAASLRRAGLEVIEYAEVRVEPTDVSFAEAIRFASDARVDGYVSLGGGSVIDTCKAANLLATFPAPLRTYVNRPVGEGQPVPGRLRPHLACPTTSGTGSEVTGIAIFDDLALGAKTGIASPLLRPNEALIDPDATDTLPGPVVACSGLDVLAHALESYTARRYTSRRAPPTPLARPMSQGGNPWSDLGCAEALRLLGVHLQRAVSDSTDREAREKVMWAATLAGIAFGNAGVHLPHAMSYAVAGQVKDFHPAGYPEGEPMVPHGMSVIVNAPAVFRRTAATSPARHLEAAGWLGAEIRGADEGDAGPILATRIIDIMRALAMPNGVSGVGYAEEDLPALVRGTAAQERLLANAPIETDPLTLAALFRGAAAYW